MYERKILATYALCVFATNDGIIYRRSTIPVTGKVTQRITNR
jgi:hypothetical protein